MEGDRDEKSKGSCNGLIHCAPGLGGGCCHPSHPVCCGNDGHCGKYGPR